MTSTQNNYANRLFNVAMSRARGKFVAVCNADYFVNKGLSEKLMFRQMIDAAKHQSVTRFAGNLLRQQCDSDICRWFDSMHSETAFFTDLNNAKKEIRIDMPAPPALNPSALSSFLKAINEAKKRGVIVHIRVEDKNSLPVELRKHVIVYGYVTNPITMIDRRIVWYGQPTTTAQFVSEGKTIPTTYRPVIRFVGSKFASALYGFLSMEKVFDEDTSMCNNEEEAEYTSFSSYVAGKKKCPDCGKALQLKKGKKAFIGCSGYPNCTHTEFVEPDVLEEYFYHSSKEGKLCPLCGTSIVAEVGMYGLYIHCCGLTKHKFKIEEL